MDDFRNNGKKNNLRGHFGELSHELIESDLYIDTVIILYIFCAKIIFLKDWCEKIVKKRWETQGSVTNKQTNKQSRLDY